MGLQVMLSLDLERGVSEERRQRFNEYLAQEHWIKIPKVTTTWRASFTDGVTFESAIQATKHVVANAASHANISYYEAALHVGSTQPISFKNWQVVESRSRFRSTHASAKYHNSHWRSAT